MNLYKEVPIALTKWFAILFVAASLWIMTFIACIPVALTSKRQKSHPFGKPIESKHSEKYISQGSSGQWYYENSNVKLFKWFNNIEDGLLGEPSGKFSSSVDGKEDKWYNKVRWILRNPYNYAKRTLDLLHCKVNECDIEFVGDYFISDKIETASGWQFTKATHRITKRTYYYFRWVKHLGNGYVRNAAIGMKIKPEHADVTQDLDDADKSFTLRLPVKQSTR